MEPSVLTKEKISELKTRIKPALWDLSPEAENMLCTSVDLKSTSPIPKEKDQVLQGLTFESFIDQVKSYLRHQPKAMPRIISAVAQLFGKQDSKSWVENYPNLFSYSDILASKRFVKINKACSNLCLFLIKACEFYQGIIAKVVSCKDPEDFQEHLADHTKPYSWCHESPKHRHVSFASYQMALNCQISHKNYPSSKEDSDCPNNEDVMDLFLSVFSKYFSSYPSKKNSRIPYALYKKCWTSAQSETTIKPCDIEICFYFAQQNSLSSVYVFDKLWPENSEEGRISKPDIFVIPSLKYFSPHDWRLLEILNNVLSKKPEELGSWKAHGSTVYHYEKCPENPNNLGYLGVSPQKELKTHRKTLNKFFSIGKGCHSLHKIVHCNLVNNLISKSILEWMTEKKSTDHDFTYFTMITPALARLHLYAKYILDEKKSIMNGEQKHSDFACNFIREFPVTGILAVLSRLVDCANVDIKKIIPDYSDVLITQRTKPSVFKVKAQPFTPQQISALAKPRELPPRTSDLLVKTFAHIQADKHYQSFMGLHDIYFMHSKDLKEEPVLLSLFSHESQKKTCLFDLQEAHNKTTLNQIAQHMHSILFSSFPFDLVQFIVNQIITLNKKESEKITQQSQRSKKKLLALREEALSHLNHDLTKFVHYHLKIATGFKTSIAEASEKLDDFFSPDDSIWKWV